MSNPAEKKRNLGRGLEALLGARDAQQSGTATQGGDRGTRSDKAAENAPKKLAIFALKPNEDQPRRHFDKESLQELAQSLKNHGLLQPILVRPIKGGQEQEYQIVAGERRWRAAQMAQIHEIPVIIKDLSDSEVAEIALVENLQRQDLNPMEEAQAYQKLIGEFGHTQEKLASILGKSRSHLANMMRLLKLPDQVQEMVATGDLSAGHARAILASDRNPLAMAQTIIDHGLSVRQAEMLAKNEGLEDGNKKSKKSPAARKSADIVALEQEIAHVLGLRVRIDHESKGDGALTILYKSLDDLDDVLDRLTLGRYRKSR